MVCCQPFAVIVFCVVGRPIIIMVAEEFAISANLRANDILAFAYGDVDEIFFSSFFFGSKEIFGTNFVYRLSCA